MPDARGFVSLRACYVSGTQPRDPPTICDWSATVTVEVSYLAGTEAETATAAGGMPYGTGVTKGGDAYVNIPVAVVPGVNGLQPALSIDYSDGRERQRADEEAPGDILGYGWRIGGLSAIRRCVRNTADADGISLDATDGLCIDGEPLVRTTGIHLRPGANYRTLRESHARITVKGTVASPWFEVALPDGRVREYGNTGDSELRFPRPASASVPLLWSINKETDAFGNEMAFEYRETESLGARHPKRIVYGDGGDAEVVFEYTGRGDVETAAVGGGTQRQWLRLHRLTVRLDGVSVREYRLESERTTQGWLRLAKVQLYGWRDAGSGTKECLEPLSVTWENPTATLPHMKTCVASVDDPLGRTTSFTRGVLTPAGSHDFLFTATEQGLFGAGTAPANAAALAANAAGNVKSLVTAVSRDNGVGGTHETTYAYQGRGWRSTRNWGFLGFHATRETDGASGVSTYTQYRLDFPHFGSPAAVVVSKGRHGSTGAEVLSKRHFAYGSKAVTHDTGTSAASTYLPYTTETALVYEGGTQLGAVQTAESAPTVTGTAVSGTVRTTTAGHSATAGSAGTVWGDAGTHAVGDVQRKATTTTVYDNVDTSTAWLAGFPSSTTVEHFKGTSATAARTAKTTRTRATTGSGGQTNAVRVETAFPDDGTLKLQTTYAHDGNGNVTAATTVGGTTGHVASRTTSREDFADARYPGTVENALDHAETLEWDAALGLPTRATDANGRILNIGYDAFGREISRERVWDGVTETTEYAACGSSCPAVSATAAACGTDAAVSADVAMKATTTSPDAPETVRHLDELGRTVRKTVESFGSSTTHRIADVLRDGRGLVACRSTPYHTGDTAKYATYGYDARGRVTSLTRADGGGVAVTYAAEASTSRVGATVRETVLDGDGTALAGTRDTVHVYDVMGELVETTAGAQAASPADRSVTRYAYDGGGLLETVTVENGTSDYATTFGHDDAGNRTSVANPNFAATTFGYTALGQLGTRTDGRGTTTWTYDVLGRTTARSDPGGGAAAWQWDPAGALGLAEKRTYDDGTSTAVEFEETYAYDGDERPTTTTTTIRKSAVAADAVTATRTLAYDTYGRPSTLTTQPSALAVGYEYNARGYLSKLKRGTAALVTYTAMDARGNATGQTYGNGVSTTRTFDDLGRATGIDTVNGTATFQDETYGWRSDGLLESRAVGTGATADTEVFAYDHLGRLSGAKTYADEASPGASSTADRTLAYGYDRLGNLTSKPGASLAYAGTGNAGPNAATSATLEVATTIAYDTSGHVTGYDAATGDDTFVEWDGRGMASRITVGASKTTASPTARDEFRYGPDGERYYRKTTWTETVAGDGGTSTTRTRWSEVYRVGGYEKVVGDGLGAYAWVDKTRAGAAQLVRTAATATATPTTAVEYLHGDHLGSLAAATDATGASLLSLAHDPYGTRRKADWTAALPAADVAALASGQNAGRARNGFTGHETLDRTGFVHMGGRLYDPRLGRFLSPDPIVSEPLSGQGWNLYSYVGNSPTSRTDPTGYCYAAGPLCQLAAGGGGFTNVTSALTRWSVSWRVPIYVSIGQWGPVSFGVGVSFWNGENGGFFGRGGFFRPRVSFRFGIPYAVFNAVRSTVSLGRETAPADATMSGGGQASGQPSSAARGVGVTIETSVDGDSHGYVIRARICKRSAVCNEAWADRVFDHVNRNDVPYSWDDLGSGRKDLFLGTQPIDHQEYPLLRRSVNTTLEGHRFHPGEVAHEVTFGQDGYLDYVIIGTGSDGSPRFTNAIGVLTFRPGAREVVRRFGHPPRERMRTPNVP